MMLLREYFCPTTDAPVNYIKKKVVYKVGYPGV
jgi:hypothetical protein